MYKNEYIYILIIKFYAYRWISPDNNKYEKYNTKHIKDITVKLKIMFKVFANRLEY